jgi:SAM-dependent methyltransferase
MKSKDELAAEQAAFWNGPGGKMWLAVYDTRIEPQLAEFSRAALDAAAARPGERVLDVGCGTGQTTVTLAGRVTPGGSALGVDISQTLIEAARSRAAGNARFEVADAGNFAFEPASFDLLFSRFGVMFFGDPVAAFRNLRAALRLQGRLTFMCWRTVEENPWQGLCVRAAAPHLPPMVRPGPGEPGPFAFGEDGRVRSILSEAGFTDISLRPLDGPMMMGKDVAQVVEGLGRLGPLARPLAEAPAEAAGKARAAVAQALAPHAGPQGVVLPGAAWIVQARPA